MSLFDDKIELIADSNELLFKDVSEIDKQLINEIIKIYSGFAINDLLEFDPEKAAQLENQLIAIIKNSNYSSTIKSYLKDFDAVSDMNVLIHKKENAININKIINENEKIRNFRFLIEDSLRGTNKLAQRANKLNALIDPIATQIRKDLILGISFKDAAAAIEKAIKDKDLGLERWVDQIAKDALNQYDGIQNDEVRKEFNMPYGRFIGSIKKTTRPLCFHMVSEHKYFEWDKLQSILDPFVKNGEPNQSYTTITGIKQKKGGGIIEGTNAENFNVLRGGYNCRHLVHSSLKPPPNN